MIDKEQIAEMAKCENCIHNYICNSTKHKETYKRNILTPVLSNIKKLKSEICKYYQPKLPKDSVVLSKEEYKLLFDIKKKFETADGDEITAVSLLMWLKELTAQERKETAEKFVKGLIKIIKEKDTYLDYDDVLEFAREQFSVEVK